MDESVSCTPNCEGRECGDDDCGGSCGDCSGNLVCNAVSCEEGCLIDREFREPWSHPFLDDSSVVDNCRFCDPSSSTIDWTIDENEPCDDGNDCTEGSTCDSSGQCTGGTQISCDDFCGECQAPEYAECDPMNMCGQCSPVGEGDPCGNGGSCDGAGTCVPAPCSGGVHWGADDACFVNVPELAQGMTETFVNTTPGWAGEVHVQCSAGGLDVAADLTSCEPLNFEWALWPLPPDDRNFFPDFEGDVVEDPVTNLFWGMVQQQDTWSAAMDSCSNLEAGSRLPTIVELRSLVDWGGQAMRYLPNSFGTDMPDGLIFWSSTPDASDLQGDMMWALHFGNGDAVPMSKSGSLPYLCVRSESALGPVVLFEQWGDHLLDPRTGLIWMESHFVEGSDEVFTYQKAFDHCHSFADGSESGTWRLPTARELLSLVDVSKPDSMVDNSFTLTSAVRVFWTGTPQRDQPADQAWAVDFDSGAATVRAKTTETLGVRCVRDWDLSP